MSRDGLLFAGGQRYKQELWIYELHGFGRNGFQSTKSPDESGHLASMNQARGDSAPGSPALDFQLYTDFQSVTLDSQIYPP